MSIITGFNHETGVHCTSSALRNVLEFHGIKMSEAMVFGLGSGMSLAYLNIPRTEPFFGGRSKDFVQDLCSILNVKLNEFRTKNSDEGWHRLKNRLITGIPSAIDIDMAYLEYQKPFLPPDFHFGAHTIVVCGYNPDRNTVMVTDTAFPDIIEITVKELTDGRNSTHDKFMTPRNLIYELEPPEKVSDVNSIIKTALHKTGSGLMSGTGRIMRLMGIHIGIKAIDAFTKAIDKWVALPEEKLINRCSMQAGYIGTKENNYGTGGGLFRFLQAEFLEEVANMIDDSDLREISLIYSELGEKWEEIARMFEALAKCGENEKKSLIQEIKGKMALIKKYELIGADRLINYANK
ncbi:MAG: BtrH N-terminal domain-containing protein [Candidatus Hodarchaeales archaeon]